MGAAGCWYLGGLPMRSMDEGASYWACDFSGVEAFGGGANEARWAPLPKPCGGGGGG